MWHLSACKNSVSLVFLNWIKNEIIFFHISELMLATLIQKYNKNPFIFDPVQEQETNLNFTAVRCHILWF